MTARDRIWQALVGLLFFVLLGIGSDNAFWREVWFFVGLGVVLSATFVEPHWVKPQDVIVNAAGAVGALFALDREPFVLLWSVLLAGVGVVALSAIIASLMRDDGSRLKLLAYKIATRFGRSIVLGGAILAFDSLTRAARDQAGAEYLAMASIALLTAVGPNWAKILQERRLLATGAMATGAVGPRVLTLASNSLVAQQGTAVRLSSSGTEALGTVTAVLPHPQGPRYQVALHGDVTELCTSFPTPLDVDLVSADLEVVGTVGPGSSDTTIEFEPLTDLPSGTPVVLMKEDNALLYQVASQKLTLLSSSGASSVVAHATAGQIGRPEASYLRAHASLPAAHELVYKAPLLQSSPPSGYCSVGKVKGTELRIGLNLQEGANGHLAILGVGGHENLHNGGHENPR